MSFSKISKQRVILILIITICLILPIAIGSVVLLKQEPFSYIDKPDQEDMETFTSVQSSIPSSASSSASSTATPRRTKVSPVPTATSIPLNTKYPVHKRIYATMFWVGEDATEENDYIPNMSSAWDKYWLEHFGGIDTPYTRNGYFPKSFKPKENPFYFALPYNDFDDADRKENAKRVPWFSGVFYDTASIIKNRWIRIAYKDHICFGQWEDVGPFETDDFEYVFGGQKPKYSKAGIDISPAMRACLRMATNAFVDWQFVDDEEVPPGPWKEIITTAQVNWQ